MYYAQFNDSFPPVMDGVAQAMLNYALWLNRKHATCCAVTPQHPMADDHEEFQVIRFASMPMLIEKEYMLGLPEIAFRAAHLLESLPLDLVHAHCPFASGTLALMTARKMDIPLVATFHSKYADDFAQRLKAENAGKIAAWYTAKFYAQADEVWTVNKSTAQTLMEYGYRGPVTVMPNGCDFLPMERTRANRQKVLQQHRLPDRPLLLFVGRLVEQKNVSLLLQALGMIKHVDCSLMLVGDGENMPAYVKLASEMGVADRVRFTGPIRDRDALQKIYAAADLFTLPSVYDTDGLVKREAAACGCPSALIEGSNAAEGIVDGVNGFTSGLDTAAYAAMLEKVLANPDLLRSAGDAACKTVYISWEQVVDRVAEEYKRIIATHKENKTPGEKRRRYYSIPVALAQELLNKQALRIKFTTKNWDRQARRRTKQAKLRSAQNKINNIRKIKEFRSKLLEGVRKRGL